MMRRIVTVGILIAGLVLFVGPLLVGSADVDRYESEVESVLLFDELNNDRAGGAPQQQVVNGWAARDLLALQAQQHNDVIELQHRQLALLVVISLLVGWAVISPADRGAATPSRTEASPSESSAGAANPPARAEAPEAGA